MKPGKCYLPAAVLLVIGWSAAAWEIALPANPNPSETTAAKELKNYLERSTGSLKIGGEEAVFEIGDTPFAKQHGVKPAKMEEEAWLIKSFGNHIVIAGGGTRGTLYGVWHFLEDHIGVRWWNYWEESVPEKKDRSFASLDDSGKPFFTLREVHTGAITPGTAITNALRNRLNRVYRSFMIGKDFGGGYDYGRPGFVHTFNSYLPPARYFKQHPEYFALSKGKRNKSQPCLSRPEVFGIFLDQLKKNIRQDEAQAKKAGVKPPSLYNISMNDNWVLCSCPDCKSFLEKERPSGMYIDFLNRLLREVRKIRPDICLETLAYYFTEEIPLQVKPEPGIVIRLCDTRSNNAFGIRHPDGKFYLDLLDKWSRTGVLLSVWDYGLTFFGSQGLPLASEFGLAETMKEYAAKNVRFIFWEHEIYGSDDMHTLKSYLEAKLLENPHADFEKLYLDFMNGYYGAAAPYLIEYRQGLNRAALARRQSHAVYDCGPSAYTFIRPEDMVRFIGLCGRAEKAVAADPVLSRRVRMARLSLDRLCSLIRPQVYASCGIDQEKLLEKYQRELDEALEFTHIAKWPVGSYYYKRSLLATKNKLKDYLLYRKLAKYSTPDTGKKVLDEFFPADCRWLRKDGSYEIVKDEKSSMKAAFRCKLGKNAFPMPAAFYGMKKIGDHPGTVIYPQYGAYRWHHIGTGRFLDHGYLYFTKSWNIQLPMGPLNDGKRVSVYASMRFAKEDGEDYLYLDRVMVTEPEAGAWIKPVRFNAGQHNDSEMLEIVPGRKYRLDAEIRTVSGQPSCHIGVRMLTEPSWQVITTPSVRMMGRRLTAVKEISGNTVICEAKPDKAQKGCYLAFDAAEGGTDLPNFKYARIAEVKDNAVTLDRIPKGARAGSKVRVHGPGGYLYAGKVGTDSEWSQYSITLNGISPAYSSRAFWPGTRYANMILLVSGKGTVEIRNARLKEVRE